MNNLFESVVLGHQSPHHLRQSYGDLGETIGEGCQQPLGLVEPLLSSSVVGQTQEVGRRHRVSARLSSILIWSNTHGGGGGGDNTLLWYSILAGSTPSVNTLQSNQLPRQALQKTDGRGSSSGFYVFVFFFSLTWLIGWNVSPNLFDVCMDLFPFGKQVTEKKAPQKMMRGAFCLSHLNETSKMSL